MRLKNWCFWTVEMEKTLESHLDSKNKLGYQASPSMGFSRWEYWSGLPFPSPGECSWPRDRTQVSCIGGRRFNLWATREFSKPGFSNMWTVNFQMFKLVLEKAEEPESRLPTSAGSWKKQESSRKTSISALLIMPKPLTEENSERDGKARPPDLPLEKSVCKSGSNS